MPQAEGRSVSDTRGGSRGSSKRVCMVTHSFYESGTVLEKAEKGRSRGRLSFCRCCVS